MTDQRIEGLAQQSEGQLQGSAGRFNGDRKLQLEGKFNEVKGRAKEGYGRVVDGLDRLVDKAPTQYQQSARKGVDFARRKPLLTTGIVAGVAVLLAGLGGRRRR